MDTSYIVLAHEADLDLIAAARCLQLQFPEAKLVHPQRVLPNAWDVLRRAKWFSPISRPELKRNETGEVHLLGISSSRNLPELMEPLTGFRGTIFLYAPVKPPMPFSFRFEKPLTHSLAAHFIKSFGLLKNPLAIEDATLFYLGVMEKNSAGLSGKTTAGDFEILSGLRKYEISPRTVGNAIILDLREGQKGLLRDLVQNITDHEVHHYPVMMTAAISHGNVQEVEPVVESIWSREDPFLFIAGIISGGRAHVWARSRGIGVDLKHCFQFCRLRFDHRWITFSWPEKDPAALKKKLLELLQEGLRPGLTAGDIMISPPISVTHTETVKNTLDVMLRFNLMGLVVTMDGSYAGIICRKDLNRAVQMNLLDSPIQPFVANHFPTVSPKMPVRMIRHLMAHHNVTRLPVVEQGKVLGILTSRELIRALDDPMPIPRDFLPLARSLHLPDAQSMRELVKRVASLKVLHLLKKIGEGAVARKEKVYLVGGVVRDFLLERSNLDMDVVVIGNAIPFAEAMGQELKGKVRVFDRFHTARVTLDDMKIDFSSARIEHYPGVGALPEVEFSGLSNDLFRRDFSVNAIALDLSPEHFLTLIDFFGGYEDLRARRIKILHSFSFMEDPTRIFRAIRFSVRFRFEFSEETQRALDVALDREALNNLSKQRIFVEVNRCLQEDDYPAILRKLYEMKLLRYLHPSLSHYDDLPVRLKLIPSTIRRFQVLREPLDQEIVQWIGILASLPVDQANDLLMTACYPSEKRKIVTASLEALGSVPGKMAHLEENDRLALYKLLAPVPLEGMVALILFGLDKNGAKRLFDFFANYRKVKCELTGKDLESLGIPPGPHYSRIFDQLLEYRLTSVITNRKEELEHAKRIFQDLQLPGS